MSDTESAYIYAAIRTPFGRYAGALAGICPVDLAAHAIRAILERAPSLDPAAIDDVILANANGNGNGAGEDNRDVARMALLLAGLPTSVPGATVNRLCGSSLEAGIQGARAIEAGDADFIFIVAALIGTMRPRQQRDRPALRRRRHLPGRRFGDLPRRLLVDRAEESSGWSAAATSPRNRSPWSSRTRAKRDGRRCPHYRPREGRRAVTRLPPSAPGPSACQTRCRAGDRSIGPPRELAV